MIVICDVALIVARLLQDEDMEMKILNDPGQAESDFELRTLAQSIALAAAEIVGDGFPVCRKGAFTVKADCVIPPSKFQGELRSIRSVKQSGAPVRFSLDSLGVHVPSAGTYEIEYAVSLNEAPAEYLLKDAIETDPRVDKELVAYLAMRNFCLTMGRTDEAAIWDQRYIRESENKRLKRQAYLPVRKWR